ncbi:MAG: hypothetical protein MZV64_31645 [Ignavibacteriales bacterium]|nr:hypothetical protein [Ignavibacteriales bacterium]
MKLTDSNGLFHHAYHALDTAADHHDSDTRQEQSRDLGNSLGTGLTQEPCDHPCAIEHHPDDHHIRQQGYHGPEVPVRIDKHEDRREARRTHDERDPDRHDTNARAGKALHSCEKSRSFTARTSRTIPPPTRKSCSVIPRKPNRSLPGDEEHERDAECRQRRFGCKGPPCVRFHPFGEPDVQRQNAGTRRWPQTAG